MNGALLVDALVPALVALAVVEWLLLRRRRVAYDWRESLASVGVAAGHRFAGAVGLVVLRPVFAAAWDHRIVTVPLDRPWGIALLAGGVELTYYWQHRLSHQVRWLWASHAVHHTSRQLTVSAAYRLAWTDLVSGTPLFALPLVFLGLSPEAVLVGVGVVIAYQFWLHTELVPRLGWFDRVFNSPSNHRAHHEIVAPYGGRNFGGVLVLFDHAFGTYAAESADPEPHYGVVPQLDSYSPVAIAFHEWRALLADLRAKPPEDVPLRVRGQSLLKLGALSGPRVRGRGRARPRTSPSAPGRARDGR